jgi:hypothetical protein
MFFWYIYGSSNSTKRVYLEATPPDRSSTARASFGASVIYASTIHSMRIVEDRVYLNIHKSIPNGGDGNPSAQSSESMAFTRSVTSPQLITNRFGYNHVGHQFLSDGSGIATLSGGVGLKNKKFFYYDENCVDVFYDGIDKNMSGHINLNVGSALFEDQNLFCVFGAGEQSTMWPTNSSYPGNVALAYNLQAQTIDVQQWYESAPSGYQSIHYMGSNIDTGEMYWRIGTVKYYNESIEVTHSGMLKTSNYSLDINNGTIWKPSFTSAQIANFRYYQENLY